jgi:hypothetical protein
MSPRMTTGAAAGVAIQIVVVLIWLASLADLKVPNDVAVALAGIITWVGGLLLHPAEPSPSAAPRPAMVPIVRSLAVLAMPGLGLALAVAVALYRAPAPQRVPTALHASTFYFDTDPTSGRLVTRSTTPAR